MYLLMRRHLQGPTGCGEGPAGQCFWSQGPTHPLLAPPRRLTGPGLSSQHGLRLAEAQRLSLAWLCYEFTTVLLKRLPRAGGQVHSEGALQEREEGEDGGRECPSAGSPDKGRLEEAVELRTHMGYAGGSARGGAQPRGPQPQGPSPLKHP